MLLLLLDEQATAYPIRLFAIGPPISLVTIGALRSATLDDWLTLELMVASPVPAAIPPVVFVDEVVPPVPPPGLGVGPPVPAWTVGELRHVGYDEWVTVSSILEVPVVVAQLVEPAVPSSVAPPVPEGVSP